jgi:hypothetical protein
MALTGDRRKALCGKGIASERQESAHALPTSLPADLAEVVESWDSLPPEVRAEVLGLIRSSLPTQEAADE